MTDIREKEYRKIDKVPENIALGSGIDGNAGKDTGSRESVARSRPIVDEFVEIIPEKKKKKKLSELLREGFGAGEKEELSIEEDEEDVQIQQSVIPDNEYTIKLPEIIKDKIPESFNVSEIGKIDLHEAEAIANEDSQFLMDSELVSGLDELIETLDKETSDKEQVEVSEHPYDQVDIQYGKKHEQEITGIPVETREQEIVKAGEKAVPTESAVIEEKPLEDLHKPGSAETADESAPGDGTEKAESREKGETRSGSLEEPEPFTEPAGKDVETAPVSAYTEPDEKEKAVKEDDISDDLSIFYEGQDQKEEPLQKEKLRDDVIRLEKEDEAVIFIDDAIVEHEHKEEGAVPGKGQLEKITGEIAGIVEGEGKILEEAGVEDDKLRVAPVIRGITPAFEDLLFGYDEEYKYSDEDLDFIHSSIVEDDYSRYLREIDEFYGVTEKKGVSRTLEFYGLTTHDLDLIEDRLFTDEYKDVNLAEAIEYLEREPERAPVRRDKDNVLYLLPDEESLREEEKRSIESDMSSSYALVFEEDINDIRTQLKEAGGEEYPEYVPEDEEGTDAAMQAVEEEVPLEGSERSLAADTADEALYDITDRVIIIDDEIDVDRFIKKFPQGKQKDMKSLFKYFDGLFEKLPEDTIRSFADSEYFDLYVKVMNDLGI